MKRTGWRKVNSPLQINQAMKVELFQKKKSFEFQRNLEKTPVVLQSVSFCKNVKVFSSKLFLL